MRVCQLCLVAASVMVASQVFAAEPSSATLEAMGLSGMQIMTDVEAMDVRGFGYRGTSANGVSWASVAYHGASAGSKNGYAAYGRNFSFGSSGSVAGVEVEISGGHGGGGHGGYGGKSKGGKGGKGGGHGGSKPQSVSAVAFSGGYSIAKNKR